MLPDERFATGGEAQRIKRMIDALRKNSAEGGRRAPMITESSPGVMLARARELVRKAS